MKKILYVIGIPVGSILGLILVYFGIIGFMNLKHPKMDCNNSNPIFEKYSFDSEIYKNELIKLIDKTNNEKTKFWFDEYIDENHISILIQNNTICAKGYITVSKAKMKLDGNFMNHLMEVKGKSYGGPLIGVKLDLISDSINPQLILTSVEDIID